MVAKHAYGLFELATAPDLATIANVGSPAHQATANEIALQAMTLLRDNTNSIPLPSPPAQLLVISPAQLPASASAGDSLFAELLREHGYQVTELIFNLDSESRDHTYTTAITQAPAYDAIIFGEWALINRYMNWGDQWQENLIRALHQANPALIIVAWHNPAATVRCSQVPTFLIAYGNTPAQVAATVAVLTGKQTPTGNLPISLLEQTIPNE